MMRWLLWLAVAFCWALMATALLAGDTFTAIATLEHQDSYDFNGVQFYELHMKGGNVTIAADADTELSRYLRTAGPKVRLTLETHALETMTR